MKYLAITTLIIIFFSYCAVASETPEDSLKVYKTPSLTVTSTRAEERKSPAPFFNIGEDIVRKTYAAEDVPMFLNMAPSVISYSQNGNGIGYSNLTMRGFDQRRISVMINGIPQNDPEDHNVYWVDFPDLAESLESIQVQRGAGLVNYGAAAIGGSINLTTSNFAGERYLKLYSGAGVQRFDDELQGRSSKFMMEFSSGLKENFAFYGRLSRVNTLGYRDHSWAYLNSFFMSAAHFGERVTTQINVFGGPLRDALVYNGLPKSYVKDRKLRRKNLSYWAYDETGENVLDDWTTERIDQEIEEFSQPHYEILNDWKISDNISMKSSLFYYTGDGYYDYSGAGWTNAESFRLTPENGFENAEDPRNPVIRAFVSNRHGGWIPRATIDHGDGYFTAGAEIRFHRADHFGKIAYAENLPENFDPDYQFYSYEGVRNAFSVFAREQYRATEDLLLGVEAQFAKQTYGIRDEKAGCVDVSYLNMDGEPVGAGGELFSYDYYFLNPRVGATWNIDENMSAYSSVAYTSREPRMRSLYAADDTFFGAAPQFESDTVGGEKRYDFSKPLSKPEKMIDLELGWTYRDEKYYINANFYWMEYFDELVKSGFLDVFGNPVHGNAPRSRHVGLELQGAATILNSASGKLKITGNATISSNKIIEHDFTTYKNEKISLDGTEIAGFPPLMGNLTVSYETGGFYAAASARYVGDMKTDNFGDALQSDERLIDHLLNADPWNPQYYYDNTLDAYAVFNADVSYKFRELLGTNSLRLHLRVNNVLNELYAAGAEGKEFFPAAERNFFLALELIY